MIRHRPLLPLVALLLVVNLGAAGPVAAQTDPYKPTVGQPGKDAVWVPTSPEMVALMLDLAGLTPQDLLVDLGSGDGRMVIAAAKRGARARGVEYTPELVELSQKTAAEEGVADRATFVQGDMFEADISDATVLALFLLPDNLRRLQPKFLDLAPGTRIVVNTLGIPGWDPDERDRIEGDCASWCEAMLYIVPARIDGTWRLPQGTLTLTQEIQKVSGTLTSGDRTLTVENGRMKGDEIRFSAGGFEYAGRVNGDTIEGTMTNGVREAPFSANRAAR